MWTEKKIISRGCISKHPACQMGGDLHYKKATWLKWKIVWRMTWQLASNCLKVLCRLQGYIWDVSALTRSKSPNAPWACLLAPRVCTDRANSSQKPFRVVPVTSVCKPIVCKVSVVSGGHSLSSTSWLFAKNSGSGFWGPVVEVVWKWKLNGQPYWQDFRNHIVMQIVFTYLCENCAWFWHPKVGYCIENNVASAEIHYCRNFPTAVPGGVG